MLQTKLCYRRTCALLAGLAVFAVCAGAVHEAWADNQGPVSFSVNGPIDPHYDGLWPPGTPLFWWPWSPPPTPVGAGPYPPIRILGVPRAEGIVTARPGDVRNYFVIGLPSEAEVFQSEPDASPGGVAPGPPAGTNNQILKDIALGLQRDNVNAYSFGEDFFNGDEDPIDSDQPPFDEQWEWRIFLPGFVEPVVASGGLPITFPFSVDPWAIGLAGTAVQNEATLGGALTLPAGPPGSADVAVLGGLGPWDSDGEAAGDVFEADPITSPGANTLDHNDAMMALLAPRNALAQSNMEDDLDALEHTGANTLQDGTVAQSGNTHDRVDPTGGWNGGWHPPDLADPNNPNHDPNNGNPIIFSVDRGSWGIWGSAVASQVSSQNEGASGDLFIAVTIPDPFIPGVMVTTNMLLIDEGQLALMPHDDLDAVIVWLEVDPAWPLEQRIEEASSNYAPQLSEGSRGFGFTIPLLGPCEAAVGFSVDTASIGLAFSAVDFECRVDGMGLIGPGWAGSGVMEQAGDIFYSHLIPPPGQTATDLGTGLLFGQNYLWFEENAIGLDPGAWSFILPGPSGNLGDLPDELNALDSWPTPQQTCDPDFDGDGDVDVNDFLTFSICFNGALNPPTPICPDLDTDLDGDGDVDVNDFLTFSACFNGALNPPAPGCPCYGGS